MLSKDMESRKRMHVLSVGQFLSETHSHTGVEEEEENPPHPERCAACGKPVI